MILLFANPRDGSNIIEKWRNIRIWILSQKESESLKSYSLSNHMSWVLMGDCQTLMQNILFLRSGCYKVGTEKSHLMKIISVTSSYEWKMLLDSSAPTITFNWLQTKIFRNVGLSTWQYGNIWYFFVSAIVKSFFNEIRFKYVVRVFFKVFSRKWWYPYYLKIS